jgi:hypothetical protein
MARQLNLIQVVLVTGLLVLWTSATAAQVVVTVPLVCFERAGLVEALVARHGERPVGRGVTDGGALVERYESVGGRTWTWVLSTPAGLACVVAAGQAWQDRKPEDDGHRSEAGGRGDGKLMKSAGFVPPSCLFAKENGSR